MPTASQQSLSAFLPSNSLSSPAPKKHLSHKSSKSLRAQRAPRAWWSPRHTPRSPGLPQPSGTHSLEHSPCQSATAHWVGPDWRRKGMSQMHVTLIQCLQTNMWEANGCKLWNKQINIFLRATVLCTSQYPRELLCIHLFFFLMQQCHTIYGPDKISATVWYVGVIAKTAKNAHSFVRLCVFLFFFRCCCFWAILYTDGTADKATQHTQFT